MIEDGADKEDFQVELLGTYPLEECLEKEKELAMTSLFPKGLNGNAGQCIVRTKTGDEKVKYSVRQRVKNGTHNWIGSESNQKRLDNGTHNFLNSNLQRETQENRVKNGTHPFLKSNRSNKMKETQDALLNDGKHIFQTKNKVVALNIETNTVSWIPSELYFQRKDIYFTAASKIFKQWKMGESNGRES